MHTLGLILVGWALIGLVAAIIFGSMIWIGAHDVDRKRNIPPTHKPPSDQVLMMNEKPLILMHVA